MPKDNTGIKTEWDLSLFYKSIDDPQIEKDIKRADFLYTKFEKKYRKQTDYLKNENALFHALKEIEDMGNEATYKPLFYLNYKKDLNSSDEAVQAKYNAVSQRLTKIGNKSIFFGVSLAKIEKKNQKKFLKSKKLLPYKYFLQKIFEASKYVLTEKEERILSLKALTSHEMWVNSTEKMVNSLTVQHEGQNIPLPKASSLIHDLTTQEERLKLHNKFMEALSKVSLPAEAELNAVVTDKKIEDELRGYKEVYDETILGYENDKKAVLNLVKTVTDNFHLANRFFKVKAKMLGLKSLNYSDRSSKVGKNQRKITFDESVSILRDIFGRVDQQFLDILNTFLRNGQIDVYPKVGKTGGAYSSPSRNSPTMVLLNNNDSMDSVSTFAHEMGHAIHSEFSKSQPSYYENYSMSTAEVASTLFETFVFYDQFNKMSPEEKIIALHDKIQDDVQTIFRQIACFNFEVEMHKTIREKGSMSKDEFCSLMNKHMMTYLGPVFKLNQNDGLFFIPWSHLRRFFYVYSYAFGQLASKALYERYSKDNKYIEKIKKFMSIGGSMSPEDTFKSIGVDVKKPDFWKDGLKTIEKDIELLEKLVNKK
jgi:oligoendopeptidase F